MESSQGTYKISNFETFKRKDIPFLCEIWNWEGDESVLPGKWANIVNKCYGTTHKSGDFKELSLREGFDK